ncbi:MaoC family dehydratase [uncultured Jatrophihabitans sp.]|uniref:MaoC family dehydratase n=1 Tax=uncultured Jatrophihabitans sp. TaxID=1610747 RepID=UPI0035CC9C1C
MAPPVAEGPWFEELEHGLRFDRAPAVTLGAGHAAVHQSIVGDRLRLALDDELARAVTGRAPLAHPGLVCDVAIGQSTLATHHVKANLFYRGLVLHRLPALGDTLHTVTEVVGLRQNQPRAGRASTGLAALRMTTRDQHDRLVLDFLRCAMLPLRGQAVLTGHADPLDELSVPSIPDAVAPYADWDLQAYRERVGTVASPKPGSAWAVGGGDVVSSAPELARLTLNIAKVHHDRAQGGGRRLVYGGHTIGLAFSQVCRVLPELVTVLGWHSCDHLSPVHEEDTLTSVVSVERVEPGPGGGAVVHLRSLVSAEEARPVLDWRFTALFA